MEYGRELGAESGARANGKRRSLFPWSRHAFSLLTPESRLRTPVLLTPVTPSVRVCLVYDCLFPYTVGGGERWYRAVAERLAAEGHAVTYLTLRQWPRGERPDLPEVRVVAVGPWLRLYTGGRRRVLPPLVFGAGVFWHLLRHRRDYDAVQTANFPFFSLLAAGAAPRCRAAATARPPPLAPPAGPAARRAATAAASGT